VQIENKIAHILGNDIAKKVSLKPIEENISVLSPVVQENETEIKNLNAETSSVPPISELEKMEKNKNYFCGACLVYPISHQLNFCNLLIILEQKFLKLSSTLIGTDILFI
jgi:hypothetical protein